MSRHVDTAAGALGPPNTPKLHERARALNRGGVHTLGGVDVVSVAISSDSALLGGAL